MVLSSNAVQRLILAARAGHRAPPARDARGARGAAFLAVRCVVTVTRRRRHAAPTVIATRAKVTASTPAVSPLPPVPEPVPVSGSVMPTRGVGCGGTAVAPATVLTGVGSAGTDVGVLSERGAPPPIVVVAHRC
jgi:hypothetical protein